MLNLERTEAGREVSLANSSETDAAVVDSLGADAPITAAWRTDEFGGDFYPRNL